jgi:uncharacterized protein YndB with AHSA1/START domain
MTTTPTRTTTPTPEVRLQRLIPASPHDVYRAWLEPELLRLWLAPGDAQVTRVEVDERVGGHFRVWQGADGDDIGGFECEIVELEPDRRLVFRWGFVGPARTDGPVFDSVLTITLRHAAGGATALTLVHEHLDSLHAALPDVANQVGRGWGLVLDTMTTRLFNEEA